MTVKWVNSHLQHGKVRDDDKFELYYAGKLTTRGNGWHSDGSTVTYSVAESGMITSLNSTSLVSKP